VANWEIMHGNKTHYKESHNPIAPCLEILTEEIKCGELSPDPFIVTPLPEGDELTFTVGEIVNVLQLSNNYREELDKPRECGIM